MRAWAALLLPALATAPRVPKRHHVLSATNVQQNQAAPLRIMPLGDSHTANDEMCDPTNRYLNANGDEIFHPLNETPAISVFPPGTYFIVSPSAYRDPLALLLTDNATDVSFSYVGRNWICGSNEGYTGMTIEWLAENIATSAMAVNIPDVVLLYAGTNDFLQDGVSPTVAGKRMRNLLDAIFAQSPTVNVLLGSVLPLNETRCAAAYHGLINLVHDCYVMSNITYFNEHVLPGVVADYREGHHISLVPMPTVDDMGSGDYFLDGIHLNVTGYEKVAKHWFAAVQPLLEKSARAQSR